MNSAIGYVRVSTVDQATNGVSVNAQRERIRAWCVANEYELVGVYTDAGVSGKRADNRPGLQSALDKACKSGAALVVYSLSRLARSTKDAITRRPTRQGWSRPRELDGENRHDHGCGEDGFQDAGSAR